MARLATQRVLARSVTHACHPSPRGPCDEAERGVTDRNDQRSPSPTESSSADGSWLADVAQAAGREAGGVPVELLGDYLTLPAMRPRPDASRIRSNSTRCACWAAGPPSSGCRRAAPYSSTCVRPGGCGPSCRW